MGDEVRSQSWIFDLFIMVLSYLAIKNSSCYYTSLELKCIFISEFSKLFDKIPVRICLDVLFRVFRFSK